MCNVSWLVECAAFDSLFQIGNLLKLERASLVEMLCFSMTLIYFIQIIIIIKLLKKTDKKFKTTNTYILKLITLI